MKKEYIYQLKIREWLEKDLGNEIMIPVYGGKKDSEWDVYIQSYLIPINSVNEHMETDEYDAHTLSPGITVYGSGECEEIIYSRWNNSYDEEPLVIERNFNGLADNIIEIAEEFRLLFNLYYNAQKKEYIDLENDESVVVKIHHNNCVCIHKRYLKTYLALKNMAILIYIDSRCVNCQDNSYFEDDGLSYRSPDGRLFYTLNIGNCLNLTKRENYSYIFAKKVVYGCDLKDCIVWPYNQDKEYIEFVIGVDDNGKEIRYTCDPNKLSNYYGVNPGAPHYLTPVYFDISVLNKYYSKPEKYSVEEGIIRCGTLWAIYIDNQHADYISAYLGDLGKDLPSVQEQYYWRGFNKIIDGKLSEVKFKRDFLSMFADSESPVFIFQKTYINLNKTFVDKLGWSLFLELDKQDTYNFESLRVPINNSIVEMDMLVLSLVKVLLDSLNEKEIYKQLTGVYERITGSISKIEMWFKEKNLQNYDEHIKFLRDLQELRSSGTGHRKGKKYQKISKTFDIKKENYSETFAEILNSATEFLKYIEFNLDNLI